MHIDLDSLPPLLKRKDAARIFGINVRYLDRLKLDGTIRVYLTKGGHARFYTQELIKHFQINGKA